jgi:drug/metabolite transporter (DMT)-like permease
MSSAETSDIDDSAPLSSWLPHYFLLSLLWGTSFLLVSVAIHSFTGPGVSFWRQLFGALTLIPILLLSRKRFPARSVWAHIAVVALLMNVGPGTLVAISESYISSSLAAILNATTPLVTLLMVALVFRDEEKLTREKVVGLFVGFAGVLVVLGVWQGLGGGEWFGIACMLVAVFGPAIAFPYTRKFLSDKVEPIPLATAQITFGTLLTAPLLLATGSTHAEPTLKAWGALLLFGVLGTGVAYILFFRIVAVAGATTTASIAYLLTVVAVLAGALVLGEHLAWYQPVGGIVVLAGAAISQGHLVHLRRLRRSAPVAVAAEDVAAG